MRCPSCSATDGVGR
ncbi:hypothetical protein IH717_23235, partial [Escherichia coli]|nr:hypothetical protein [Escherichia coli]